MNETHQRYVTHDDPQLDPSRTITMALVDARQCSKRAASALGVAASLERSDERQAEIELAHLQLQRIVAMLETLVRS